MAFGRGYSCSGGGGWEPYVTVPHICVHLMRFTRTTVLLISARRSIHVGVQCVFFTLVGDY